MANAYNIRNLLHRSGLASRGARLDPGSQGVVIVSPVDRGTVVLTGIGARTLEDPVGLGVGTTILCISQTAAVTIEGITVNAGEWVEFMVVLNAAGVHVWEQRASTAITQQV